MWGGGENRAEEETERNGTFLRSDSPEYGGITQDYTFTNFSVLVQNLFAQFLVSDECIQYVSKIKTLQISFLTNVAKKFHLMETLVMNAPIAPLVLVNPVERQHENQRIRN